MAEYLLKGGRGPCPACGCPLFEYKKKASARAENPSSGDASIPVHGSASEAPRELFGAPPVDHVLALPKRKCSPENSPGSVFLILCQRIKNDDDPDRCLALTDAVSDRSAPQPASDVRPVAGSRKFFVPFSAKRHKKFTRPAAGLTSDAG